MFGGAMPEKSATKVMTQQENAPRENGGVKRGRPFAKGNAGRPRGSKNRTTVVAQALLAGAEPELVRKAIELAKAGDVQMLKFLLDRLLPKNRLVKVDIPRLDFADEVIDAMAAISGAIAEGQITPSEGAAVSNMISGYSRAIEVWDLSRRIEAIEASLNDEERRTEAIEALHKKTPIELIIEPPLNPKDEK
jgi:hypothetical protein